MKPYARAIALAIILIGYAGLSAVQSFAVNGFGMTGLEIRDAIPGVYTVYATMNDTIECEPQTIEIRKADWADYGVFISGNPFAQYAFLDSAQMCHLNLGEIIDVSEINWDNRHICREMGFRSDECHVSTYYINNDSIYCRCMTYAVTVKLSDRPRFEQGYLYNQFISDEEGNWILSKENRFGEKVGIGLAIEHSLLGERDIFGGIPTYWEESPNIITDMKLIKKIENGAGINEFESEPVMSAAYDLYGRKVDNPCNGIYIKNGKKIIL